MEQTTEQPTGANGVVDALALELQQHPNLTPERRAWIEREAPTMRDPLAWAAANIRDGWQLPKPTSTDGADWAKRQREAWRASFDAMPDEAKPALLAEARRQLPNLAPRRDDDKLLRIEAGSIMWLGRFDGLPKERKPALLAEARRRAPAVGQLSDDDRRLRVEAGGIMAVGDAG